MIVNFAYSNATELSVLITDALCGSNWPRSPRLTFFGRYDKFLSFDRARRARSPAPG